MRGALARSTASSPTLDVVLSPDLPIHRLPRVVDAVRVQWSRNPFGALPPGESGLGGILEYTLREGGTEVVPLPPTDLGGSAMPVHYRVALGRFSTIDRWLIGVCVCVCGATTCVSMPAAHVSPVGLRCHGEWGACGAGTCLALTHMCSGCASHRRHARVSLLERYRPAVE